MFFKFTSLFPWVSSAREVLRHQQELSSLFSKVSVLFCRKCCPEHLVKENTNKKGNTLIKRLIQQNRLWIVCSEIWFTLLLVDNGQAVRDFHCFGFKSKQSSLALGVIRKYKRWVIVKRPQCLVKHTNRCKPLTHWLCYL